MLILKEISRKELLIAAAIVVAILWFTSVLVTYFQSLNEPPVIFAEIPDETLDFLRRLSSHGDDVKIRYNPEPDPDDWEDGNNPGEEAQYGLLKLEDPFFIVYYSPELSQVLAQSCLQYANEAVLKLKDLFGRYYYPRDVNNRKLAFYLVGSQEEYFQIGRLLHGADIPSVSVAVTIFELSAFGWLTKGIVLSPETYRETRNYFRQVVWHEMAHYVYFTSLEVENILRPYRWISEGVAEYFADARYRTLEIDLLKVDSIHLVEDVRDYNDAYWVGYTVFLYMENDFTRNVIKQFILHSYSVNPMTILPQLTGLDTKRFEQQWKAFIIMLSRM